VIAGTIDVNSTVTGGTVNATATTLNVNGGNFQSTAGNFTGYVAGTLNVSLGGRLYGNPDVHLTVGSGINITGAGSKIEAASGTSVYAFFPTLASGGYFVNSVPGLVWDPATGTGFFAGGAGALLGQGLIVTYGLSTVSGLSQAVIDAIQAGIEGTNRIFPRNQDDRDDRNSGSPSLELQCN
jgi:hypothetical protein